MPLFRFVLFASGFIALSLFLLDRLSSPVAVASGKVSGTTSSLTDWRQSETRKNGPTAEGAIVLPSLPRAAPTTERLAFERQLAGNVVPLPAWASQPNPLVDARAELTEASPQQRSPMRPTSKPRRKMPRQAEVAAAERSRSVRDVSVFPFFSN